MENVNIKKQTQYNLIGLLLELNKNKQQGFGFAIISLLALVVVGGLVSATMMAKASFNQNSAIANVKISQAEEAVKAGFAELQTFFAANPVLLTLDSTSWTEAAIATKIAELQGNGELVDAPGFNEDSDVTTINACSGLTTNGSSNNAQTVVANLSSIGITVSGNNITSNWTSLSNTTNAEYQLLAYSTDGNTGQLTVAGRVDPNSASPTASYAEIRFPVGLNASSSGGSMPTVDATGIGIWVKAPSSSRYIDTNILVSCSGSNETWTFENGGGPLGNPRDYFNSRGHEIIGTDMAMPPTPPTPTNAGEINTDISGTLPRTGDKYKLNADGTRDYQYVVSSMSGATVVNLTQSHVTSGRSLPADKYDTVSIYVDGDISMAGGGAIKNTCIPNPSGSQGNWSEPTYPSNCHSSQLRVYGKAGSGTISLTGNSAICSAFIHAPNYDVSLSGGGQAQGCYSSSLAGQGPPTTRGVFWVNSWNGGGQGNHMAHSGTFMDANGGELPYAAGGARPGLDPANGWQKIAKP